MNYQFTYLIENIQSQHLKVKNVLVDLGFRRDARRKQSASCLSNRIQFVWKFCCSLLFWRKNEIPVSIQSAIFRHGAWDARDLPSLLCSNTTAPSIVPCYDRQYDTPYFFKQTTMAAFPHSSRSWCDWAEMLGVITFSTIFSFFRSFTRAWKERVWGGGETREIRFGSPKRWRLTNSFRILNKMVTKFVKIRLEGLIIEQMPLSTFPGSQCRKVSIDKLCPSIAVQTVLSYVLSTCNGCHTTSKLPLRVFLNSFFIYSMYFSK